jgi:hypothetical protein
MHAYRSSRKRKAGRTSTVTTTTFSRKLLAVGIGSIVYELNVAGIGSGSATIMADIDDSEVEDTRDADDGSVLSNGGLMFSHWSAPSGRDSPPSWTSLSVTLWTSSSKPLLALTSELRYMTCDQIALLSPRRLLPLVLQLINVLGAFGELCVSLPDLLQHQVRTA